MAEREELLNSRARPALESLWQECAESGFRGRCWGNSTDGSNITLCDGASVVVVYQGRRRGPLKIRRFGKSQALVRKVRRILRQSNLIE